ncbi:MAG: hypothetical protein Q7S20_05820 [Gemmatimonadaceae bacterium]|nr:hypothetical protein [Gemmatimonadaceae bacterium]
MLVIALLAIRNGARPGFGPAGTLGLSAVVIGAILVGAGVMLDRSRSAGEAGG